jgi:ketosteroid isomerase-like protein
MNEIASRGVADRFFAAIERNDLAVIGEIYAPDATVWHNYDGIGQSRADNLAVLASFPMLFETFKYCDVQRRFFEGGLVQQHVLQGTTKAGAQFALYACMIISIRGEQIWRIEEYFDSAQVPVSVPLPR